MHRLASAALFALVLGNVAGATEITITDGQWWGGLSQHEREVALFAAFDGFGVGYGEGRVAGILATARPIGRVVGYVLHPGADQLARLKTESARAMQQVVDDRRSEPHFGGMGITEYVDRVTRFYDQHPGAQQRITIGNVIQCVTTPPLRTCDALASEAAH
jgi:hypothetical protein